MGGGGGGGGGSVVVTGGRTHREGDDSYEQGDQRHSKEIKPGGSSDKPMLDADWGMLQGSPSTTPAEVDMRVPVRWLGSVAGAVLLVAVPDEPPALPGFSAAASRA